MVIGSISSRKPVGGTKSPKMSIAAPAESAMTGGTSDPTLPPEESPRISSPMSPEIESAIKEDMGFVEKTIETDESSPVINHTGLKATRSRHRPLKFKSS